MLSYRQIGISLGPGDLWAEREAQAAKHLIARRIPQTVTWDGGDTGTTAARRPDD